MDLYTCKVRLDGSLDNEVIKQNVTAAEIHLLSQIHQAQGKHPPVVDIVKTGIVNRADAKERARLAETYSRGELTEDRGTRMIQNLFGVAGVPLPQSYVAPEVFAAVEFDLAEEAEVEEIIPVEVATRSTTLRDSKLSLKSAGASA